jgi:hypothetical protein
VRALKPLRPALPRQLRATPPLRAKQPTKLLYRHQSCLFDFSCV